MERAVLFDLDGVISAGWHERQEKRAHSWSRTIRQDLGIHEAEQEAFFKGPFVKDVLTGLRSLEEALCEFLPKTGCRCDAQAYIRYWFAHDATMRAELLDVVARIKATGRVKLYIATNNEKTRMDYLWESAGLKELFDDRFFAGEFKVLKPDPAFFRKCEERIGDRGDKPPLFFDDSPVYCAGARAAGWEAVLFDDVDDCLKHPYIMELLAEK